MGNHRTGADTVSVVSRGHGRQRPQARNPDPVDFGVESLPHGGPGQTTVRQPPSTRLRPNRSEAGFTRTEREREEIIRRLVRLLTPSEDESISKQDLPGGVDKPHQVKIVQHTVPETVDLEELASLCDLGIEADRDVGVEVIFKNESRLAPDEARRRVEEWLQKASPAWKGRCPNEILDGADEREREYLLALVAGLECGICS